MPRVMTNNEVLLREYYERNKGYLCTNYHKINEYIKQMNSMISTNYYSLIVDPMEEWSDLINLFLDMDDAVRDDKDDLFFHFKVFLSNINWLILKQYDK
jgi:hypothetical protein